MKTERANEAWFMAEADFDVDEFINRLSRHLSDIEPGAAETGRARATEGALGTH
ncbi:MAG: hypothetical protein AAFX58_00865 [Pseudomonadota bacterium]